MISRGYRYFYFSGKVNCGKLIDIMNDLQAKETILERIQKTLKDLNKKD